MMDSYKCSYPACLVKPNVAVKFCQLDTRSGNIEVQMTGVGHPWEPERGPAMPGKGTKAVPPACLFQLESENGLPLIWRRASSLEDMFIGNSLC